VSALLSDLVLEAGCHALGRIAIASQHPLAASSVPASCARSPARPRAVHEQAHERDPRPANNWMG